jgi:hypothetical protein
MKDVDEPVELKPEGVSSQPILEDIKLSMALLGDFTADDVAESKTIKLRTGTDFT